MLSVQPDTKPKGCAGCNRKIKDRYLLKALDKYWHEGCLKCACCDCRLGEHKCNTVLLCYHLCSVCFFVLLHLVQSVFKLTVYLCFLYLPAVLNEL
uniref:LIM domain only protein 3 n=1 Tax=Moschus moschiferus TaxID=68415 RepID=A0A8C6D9T5_MOSMO